MYNLSISQKAKRNESKLLHEMDALIPSAYMLEQATEETHSIANKCQHIYLGS